MKTILKISLLLVLSTQIGCSPSARLNRLLIHHPELKIFDTIVISDTMTIPQVEVDTVFYLDSIHDTIILQKDRLEITLSRIHDTLYIRGKCKADTIIIHRTIPVEKIKVVKPDKLDQLISKIPWLISGLIFMILLLALLVFKFKM
jgi:hypothetical protein